MTLATRIFLSLCIFCMLSGCSIKMAYNNMDRLVRWGVSDYVDLNREQKAVLDREIKRIRYWHRVNHLSQYADFTHSLAVRWSDQVTIADIQMAFDQMTSWIEELQEQTTPLVIDMMISLTDQQIAELPQRLEASNLELAEPELGVELGEAQALWAEELTDRMRRFTGRLSDDQKNYVKRRSSGYRPERVLWAEYRRRFQKDLLALLQHRQDRDRFVEGYRALVASREAYYGPELTEIFKHNEALSMDVSAHLLSNLSEKQSNRFVDELTELGDIFAELATQVDDDRTSVEAG